MGCVLGCVLGVDLCECAHALRVYFENFTTPPYKYLEGQLLVNVLHLAPCAHALSAPLARSVINYNTYCES